MRALLLPALAFLLSCDDQRFKITLDSENHRDYCEKEAFCGEYGSDGVLAACKADIRELQEAVVERYCPPEFLEEWLACRLEESECDESLSNLTYPEECDSEDDFHERCPPLGDTETEEPEPELPLGVIVDGIRQIEALASSGSFGPWDIPVIVVGTEDSVQIRDAISGELLTERASTDPVHTVAVMKDDAADEFANDTLLAIAQGARYVATQIFDSGSFGATVDDGQRWGDVWVNVEESAGYAIEAVTCGVGALTRGTWDYGTYHAAPQEFMSLPGAKGICISASGIGDDAVMAVTTAGELYTGTPGVDKEAVFIGVLDDLLGVDLGEVYRLRCDASAPEADICIVAAERGRVVARFSGVGGTAGVTAMRLSAGSDGPSYDADAASGDGRSLFAAGSGGQGFVVEVPHAGGDVVEHTIDLSPLGSAEVRSVDIEDHNNSETIVWTFADETGVEGGAARTTLTGE